MDADAVIVRHEVSGVPSGSPRCSRRP
jgi:hypothetical protein